MTANTWLERLVLRPKAEREIILEYLTGMDEAGPLPDLKWLKERLAARTKNGTPTPET